MVLDRDRSLIAIQGPKSSQILNEVIDAKKLIKKYIPELNDHDELFFVEFILWGLESYNKLSILRTNNGIEYKDPFNNFINKI